MGYGALHRLSLDNRGESPWEEEEAALELLQARGRRQYGELPWRARVCRAAMLIGTFVVVVISGYTSRIATTVASGNQLNASFSGETATLATTTGAKLTVQARSENYLEYSEHARSLYGFDLLAEPHVATILTATSSSGVAGGPGGTTFVWSISPMDDYGRVDKHAPALLERTRGDTVSITLTNAGGSVQVEVSEIALDESLISSYKGTMVIRYVRRELRELTNDDREKFFNALSVLYTLGEEEGKKLYGDAYVGREVLAAMHNGNGWCYHDGLQFLTAHWGFNNLVERSLRLVDPTVSLAYWDFMVEGKTLGPRWPESEIFAADMFGSAMNDPAEDFRLGDGRFKGTKMVYSPKGNEFVSSDFVVSRNAYGWVSSPTNSQDTPYVSRTHSYCGLPGSVGLPKTEKFVSCFAGSDIYTWATCMERQIHANMHGWLGGAWNCPVDFLAWTSANPEASLELVTFALTYVTANRWPNNNFMSEYNWCPMANTCSTSTAPETITATQKTRKLSNIKGPAGPPPKGDEQTPENMDNSNVSGGSGCVCICTLDVDTLSDSEVYALMEPLMMSMARSYGGEDFVLAEDDGERKRYIFKQNEAKLSYDLTIALLRALATTACKPGFTGAMSTGASPADPIFWVLHPLFDKALHALTLSPTYIASVDTTWKDLQCPGSKLKDTQPFTESQLGIGKGTTYLTNEEISGKAMGEGAKKQLYVYDRFTEWGGEVWDPLE